eukprot:Phypoly_transcript_22022.p1 GENE.Phypoly_transcript_22022~~Phypoly_transcript_22022.p1  ORF type:complete len:169 (-),score=10.06 Phypoly_transcript_22022:9-515(-)
MAEHTRKRSQTSNRSTSPGQQDKARSPSMSSKDKSFLGGRPPTSPQAISNKPTSFIANSRASMSMKGSPLLVAHYIPEEPQHSTSPTSRERTTTISGLLYKEPNKRSIEDKMERLVALREAIHVALQDVSIHIHSSFISPYCNIVSYVLSLSKYNSIILVLEVLLLYA